MRDHPIVKPQHRQQIFAFAVLLLLQFAAGPTCCLPGSPPAGAHRAAIASLLLPAEHSHGHAGTPGLPSTSESHLCPACHDLGHGVILAGTALLPQPVVWRGSPGRMPAARLVLPAPADTRPGQPRAPPALG
jgi:hypothetical protein